MMRNHRLLPACLLLLGVLPGLGSDGAKRQAPATREKSHWAFQPVVRPALPAVRDAGRVRTPVDRFILAGSAIVVLSVILVTSAKVRERTVAEELPAVEAAGD